MAREKPELRLEAPIGRMLTQAMREEAVLDEKNGKDQRAARWRRSADNMDRMTDLMKGRK